MSQSRVEIGQLREEIGETRREVGQLRGELAAFRAEFGERLTQVRNVLREDIAAHERGIAAGFASLSTNMRRLHEHVFRG